MSRPMRSANKTLLRRPKEMTSTEGIRTDRNPRCRSRQDTSKITSRGIPRVPSVTDRTRPPLRSGDGVDSVMCEGTE